MVNRPIYARARVLTFTKSPGEALQPGWEFAKQLATNAAGFAGTGNEFADGGRAVAETVNERAQTYLSGKSRIPKHVAEAKKKIQENKDNPDFGARSVKTAAAIEFDWRPLEGGRQIGTNVWYFRQRHEDAFAAVLKTLNQTWNGV